MKDVCSKCGSEYIEGPEVMGHLSWLSEQYMLTHISPSGAVVKRCVMCGTILAKKGDVNVVKDMDSIPE